MLRRVYTWQWIEIVHKENKRTLWGGKTTTLTYEYKKGWYPRLIDHSAFKQPESHENPILRQYDSLLLNNKTASFGMYTLDTLLLSAINNYILVKLDSIIVKQNTVIGKDSTECLSLGFFTSKYSEGIYSKAAKSAQQEYNSESMNANTDGSGGLYYHNLLPSDFIFIGKDIHTFEIGDTKIVYWYIPEGEYTIIGEKNNNKLQAYQQDNMFITSDVSCGGFKHSNVGYFGILLLGRQSVEQMFNSVHDQNNMKFIFLRLAGVLCMFGGFLIFGHPLILLLGWIPFIGHVWEKLIFKILQIISIIVSLSISWYYWVQYNNIHNLSIWDFYFGLMIIVLILFCYSASAEVKSGNKTLYSGDF